LRSAPRAMSRKRTIPDRFSEHLEFAIGQSDLIVPTPGSRKVCRGPTEIEDFGAACSHQPISVPVEVVAVVAEDDDEEVLELDDVEPWNEAEVEVVVDQSHGALVVPSSHAVMPDAYFDIGEQGVVRARCVDKLGLIGRVVNVPNCFWPGYTHGHTACPVVGLARTLVTFADGSCSRAYIIEAEGFHYPIKPAFLKTLPPGPTRPTPGPPAPVTPAIGARIEIFWSSEAAWSAGVVDSYDHVAHQHLVRYDDDGRAPRWHRFAQHEFTGEHSTDGIIWSWRNERFEGCFCQSSHSSPDNPEGLWLQCDFCSRWCHGECAGVHTEEQAAALDPYVCPLCLARGAPQG